jgi:glycosyltransferase A (GT-A) superfamily protein (DUF2064 family)
LRSGDHGESSEAGRGEDPLAACLPSAAITGLYRCLLEDTVDLAKSLDGVETAVMSPAGDVEDLARMLSNGAQVVAQTGEGLGAGLTSVFAHFAAAVGRRIVAFDSDSPHLPSSALRLAFDALRSCDLVVGPTHDGGYYLVGGKASHPALFAAGAMGTTSACGVHLKTTAALATTPLPPPAASSWVPNAPTSSARCTQSSAYSRPYRRTMTKFLRRLRYWLHRRRMDAELAEEMEFHRGMLAAPLPPRGTPRWPVRTPGRAFDSGGVQGTHQVR